jgi:hypothetical protein
MDGKIQQCVCIKFCMKLGKSDAEILETLRQPFQEYTLSRTEVLNGTHVSSPVESQLKMNVQNDQEPEKREKILK